MIAFVFASLLGLPANAATPQTMPTHRAVFEFPASAGTIAKMQIDMVQVNKVWYARFKAVSRKGETKRGHLQCVKLASTEFSCSIEFGGGSFHVQFQPTPKITTSYFCANREDERATVELKPAREGDQLIFDGKTAVIAKKDAF